MSVILTEKKGHTGYITLNRPDKYNTFTLEFAELLNRALTEYEKDTEIRAVVIKSNGKHFSTGINLHDFDDKSPNDYRKFIAMMDMHNHTISKMSKPVIASVKGYAVANGAGLSFACDLTVASESAKFGTTAINAGLICTGPGIPLLANIGRKKAMEMVLMGEILTAQQAYELGLVNWVVKDDELEAKTDEIAAKIAQKSPLAIAAGKRGLSRSFEVGYSQAIDFGTEVFASLCLSEDAKEGVRAFLEKRQPEFKLK